MLSLAVDHALLIESISAAFAQEPPMHCPPPTRHAIEFQGRLLRERRLAPMTHASRHVPVWQRVNVKERVASGSRLREWVYSASKAFPPRDDSRSRMETIHGLPAMLAATKTTQAEVGGFPLSRS
jgi:ribosomal protein L39E